MRILHIKKRGTFPDIDYELKKFKQVFEITGIAMPDTQTIRLTVDKFRKAIP